MVNVETMEPIVSIIIPTYNPCMEYLNRSVQSALDQKLHDFEIIIVDDGSDASIGNSIAELQKKDSRIRILRQNNCGVSSARNNGIRNARGKYMAFLDDDDILSPFFLEESVETIERYNADYVLGGVIHQQSACFPSTITESRSFNTDLLIGDSVKHYMSELLGTTRRTSDGGYISRGPVAKLIRKTSICALFPEDIVYGEDLLWNLRLLSSLDRVVIANRTWYLYIANKHSTTKKCSQEAILQEKTLIENVWRIISDFSFCDTKLYGDYIYFEMSNLRKRWFNHPKCSLSHMQKVKEMHKVACDEPWSVLSSRDYLRCIPIRRKFKCILFKLGLLAVMDSI